MSAPPKLLLLDDDRDLLELYREMLSRLPSRPEVHTANTGARAIAMLSSEPFSLLICDLKMPNMDGLQVLAIVRRKFPQLRTVVMTASTDEQFRVRAYAMGLDLYLEKPNTAQSKQLFMDCIESLLEQEAHSGFRGVQSKSLIDILQLECLGQSSSVLRITHGLQEGRIWLLNGAIIDAVAGEMNGEKAFHRILSWKTGNFEILPADQNHPPAIAKPWQSLLLETVQVLDETTAQAEYSAGSETASAKRSDTAASLARHQGIDSVLVIGADTGQPIEQWAVEDPEATGAWVHQTMAAFNALGEELRIGALKQIEAFGLQRHVVLLSRGQAEYAVGFRPNLSPASVREITQEIVTRWAS